MTIEDLCVDEPARRNIEERSLSLQRTSGISVAAWKLRQSGPRHFDLGLHTKSDDFSILIGRRLAIDLLVQPIESLFQAGLAAFLDGGRTRNRQAVALMAISQIKKPSEPD